LAVGRSRGFTIAEVLAALVVMAIGLIGIAALYSDGLQTTLESSPRTQAAELAASIAQRIEANAAGRIGYISAIGVLCDPTKTPRAPEDVAAQEAACWEDEVERSLPSGLGSITRDRSTTPPTFTIAVSWSDETSGAASYVIRVQPKD
jgi:type IV pilus assembly protein PilV